MDEKVLVKSERYKIGRGLLYFMAAAGVVYLLWGILEELGLDLTPLCERDGWRFGIWGLAGLGLICLLIYAWMHSYELIVTDKRVYGKTAFGRRVDLPVDSVSAIGSRWLKGIAVATASGKIDFLMIKNCDEIHKCVSNLLIDRQRKTTDNTVSKQEAPQSSADELKKYKELLDGGVITQEEFDAKKKQLLGL